MAFTVLIPARLASTRLPDKPLADIGGKPMVVRVAQRAALSKAARVTVAADDARIVDACREHGVEALLTRPDHPSGSDRLAQAATLLGLSGSDCVVNVQGDEPLIEPSLIDAVGEMLESHPQASMTTAAHAIASREEFENPNVVKVVLDAAGYALYFSRSPIPCRRDASSGELPEPAPLRHVGIYGYRAAFLRSFPALSVAPIETSEALEQLRAMWHGHRIAVHVSQLAPGIGVDTQADLERARAAWQSLSA